MKVDYAYLVRQFGNAEYTLEAKFDELCQTKYAVGEVKLRE